MRAAKSCLEFLIESNWPIGHIYFRLKFNTLFLVYKNIFYKNIEAEVCEILRIHFFFFNKNIVFAAQAEYSYFSADFRLKQDAYRGVSVGYIGL